MPDDANQQLPTIYAARVTGHSVSQDGTMVAVMCERSDGEQIALALRTEQVGNLLECANEIFHELRRRRITDGLVPARTPRTFGVAPSDEHRGCTILSFDPNTPKEVVFILGLDPSPVRSVVDPSFAAMLGRQLLDVAGPMLPPNERAKFGAPPSRLIIPRG